VLQVYNKAHVFKSCDPFAPASFLHVIDIFCSVQQIVSINGGVLLTTPRKV